MTVQRQPQLQSILPARLQVTQAEITKFCRRWNVVEFALFGLLKIKRLLTLGLL